MTKRNLTFDRWGIIKELTDLEISIRFEHEPYFGQIEGVVYEKPLGRFRVYLSPYKELFLSWDEAEELLMHGSCNDGKIWIDHPVVHNLIQMTAEEAKEYIDNQKPNRYDIIDIVKTDTE